jgi:hypothetical protein
MTAMLQGVAPLDHLGVIRAKAERRQIPSRPAHPRLALLDLRTRLCAFLSAKGRMQASFIGFKRSPTEVWLVCQRPAGRHAQAPVMSCCAPRCA